MTTIVESSALDVEAVRADFPILSDEMEGRPLVYLDNANTTQKPRVVIDRLVQYYRHENSNVHRSVHALSEAATRAYEGARETVRRFINAREARECVFVRGTTEALNLVAQTYGRANLGEGDEVLITAIEHHSNIVPWQMITREKGAVLRVVPVLDSGEIDFDAYRSLLSERTKLVGVVHISNSLGTINPVERMIAEAHERNIPVLVDGAQAAPHRRIDVQALDADFYALSSHKVFGPTGIGVLYGKAGHLRAMPPWQGGGDMILSVTFEKTKYNEIPFKFEAGTPNIADVIAFGTALEYVEGVGIERIERHEAELLGYATDRLLEIPGLRIIGNAAEKASVISFTLEGIHPHDIGTIVGRKGVAIRTGHHCTQPVMQRFGVPATARASFAMYNTKTDVDALAAALLDVIEVFA